MFVYFVVVAQLTKCVVPHIDNNIVCLFVCLLFSQSDGGSIEINDTHIRRLLKHTEILTVHTYIHVGKFRMAIKWAYRGRKNQEKKR